MTRIIKLNDTKPLILESPSGKPVWVCRCGLSEQWPYCDSSHIATSGEREDTLYEYTRERPGALPTRRVCRVAHQGEPVAEAMPNESPPVEPEVAQ